MKNCTSPGSVESFSAIGDTEGIFTLFDVVESGVRDEAGELEDPEPASSILRRLAPGGFIALPSP
jgi:hypothetical protein